MNGNITKEASSWIWNGLHRVGIGGFQNFDAALNTPKLVDKRLNLYDARIGRTLSSSPPNSPTSSARGSHRRLPRLE